MRMLRYRYITQNVSLANRQNKKFTGNLLYTFCNKATAIISSNSNLILNRLGADG